eukprot:CAMPEP_0118933740 /NCGR_PEP_ID=MMETSP1169-20130426/12322_1 /TAXON_ID=36882 /ORGANISM="Pyramimonas obovata, Strain CCMP722" /LENGTH=184 /DNA_ID=CAMNT_0006876547 /DNA_START=101 /DNA_END=655 /DNA_ORIENTATION=+
MTSRNVAYPNVHRPSQGKPIQRVSPFSGRTSMLSAPTLKVSQGKRKQALGLVVRAGGNTCRTDLMNLPGDPSLTVFTNVSMGDKKMDFMLKASKAVASCLGKPESYVAVCVEDGKDLIWGGKADPAALCTLYSLGAINLQNNKALSAELCTLLAEHGIPSNRYYINFFDLPRENCGYDGATFGG